MERAERRAQAHRHPDAQTVRTWAVEQALGVLVEGQGATMTDVVRAADVLATYALLGEVSA